MLRGGWGLRRQQAQQQQPQSPPQPVAAAPAAPRSPPKSQQFSDHSFAVDDDAPVYFSQNEMADFSPSLQNLIEEQNNGGVDTMMYEEDTASTRNNNHHGGGGPGERLQGKDRGGGRDSVSSANQQFWIKCLDEKENSRDADKPSPLGHQDSRRFSLDGSRRSSLEEFRAGIVPSPGSPHRSSPTMRSSSPASKTLVEKDGNTTPRDGNPKSPSKQIHAETNEDYSLNLVDSSDYDMSFVYSQSFSFDPVPVKEATSVEVSRSDSASATQSSVKVPVKEATSVEVSRSDSASATQSSVKSSPERLGALPRDAIVEEGLDIYAQEESSSEEDNSEPSLGKPKSISLNRKPLREVLTAEDSGSGVSRSMSSSPERSGALPRIPFNEISTTQDSGSGVSPSMRSSPNRSGALPRIPFKEVSSVEAKANDSGVFRRTRNSPTTARSGALPRDTIAERGQEMYTQAGSSGSGDMYEEPNLVKSTTFSFEDIKSQGSEDSPDLIEKLRRRSGVVDDRLMMSTRSEESDELLSKPSLQISASSTAPSPSSFVNGTMHPHERKILKSDSKEEDSACVESFKEQEAREELEYQEQQAREDIEYRGNAAQEEDEYFSPTSSYARSGLAHGPRFSDSGDFTTSSSHRHLAFVESDDSLLEELTLKHELASRLRNAAEFSLMDADEESDEETEEDVRELEYLYKENANEAAGDISGDSEYIDDIEASANKHATYPYKDDNSQLSMDALVVVGVDAHVYPNFLEDIPESQEEHEHELEEEEVDYDLAAADSNSSTMEEWNFGYGNSDPPSNSVKVVAGAHRNAVDELLLESTGTYDSLVGVDYVTNEGINGAERIAEPVSESRAEPAMTEKTPESVPKSKVKIASDLVDCSDEHELASEDTIRSPSKPTANTVFSRTHVEDKEVIEETTETVAKPTARYTSYLANVPDQSKAETEEKARFVTKSAVNVESSRFHVAVEDKLDPEKTAKPAAITTVRTSYLANLPDEFKVETEDSAAAAAKHTAKQVSSCVKDPVETKVELKDISEPTKPTVRRASHLANVPVERPETEDSSGIVAKLTANIESAPVHIPIESKGDFGETGEPVAKSTASVESSLDHVPDETKMEREESPELLAESTTNFESSSTYVPAETEAHDHAPAEIKADFKVTAESEANVISSRVHVPVATTKVELEENAEAVPTSAHVACSSDVPVAQPVFSETKMELETMSEPATTLADKVASSTVEEEDPFEWAYAVWRRRGLMSKQPSNVNVEKLWRNTACQIVVPSSHEKLETIITPRVSYIGSLNPQGVVDDVPTDEKRDWSASKMTKSGGKGFANVMQKWRDKSDGMPNTHFLSPEANAPMAREADLPETTHIYNIESPRLANDNPIEKSFEPASTATFEESEPKPVPSADLEKTEPRRADFDALNAARADSSENFYFKAIKYHEKPGSKTEDKGKKALTKRQSLEIGSRPRIEAKESTRRQSYGGNQQTRQDAKRPIFETPPVHSNKGPTTQASKIKAAYNKQRLSIERLSIDEATKSQSEPKQHRSTAPDDGPMKAQREADFQRHKSPPRSRGDFKTAVQTALRERVPDFEPKGDLQPFPSQVVHQANDREKAVVPRSSAQAQSKKHSDVQNGSSHAESAKQGQNEPHRRGFVSLLKKESRSSVDIYGYNPSPKIAAAIPMRDQVILEEEEDSEYDFDGKWQERDVPRTVEMATDEMGIPMASSADDESVDERVKKPKSSSKRTSTRPSLNQEDQDYSPWTKKLVENLDEEQEDDQRITPREEAFSERPWRHDMVIARVKSFGEQSSQPAVEVESDKCHCSNSLFSGNDKLVDFFLPLMGMACSCGKRQQLLENPEEPTALENILRPWQVDFLGAFGICRGDQLVKAQHRSGKALSTALRQYRRKQDMAPFRTKSCAMAIQIWAKTCKAFVRSIRQQLLTGTSELKLPNTLYILSSFLEKMPGQIDGTDMSCSTHSSHLSISREVDEADLL